MIWMRLGCGLMFLAVALGAFGAHGLRTRISPDMLVVFETGVRYHVYHALGLLALGWLSETHPSGLASTAGWAFVTGVLVFSGSLYALSMSGVRWLGAITPVGGVAFLAGWLLLTFASFRAS